MKINISLNPKSIEKAIKQFQKAQIQLETVMIREFLEECCKYIVSRSAEFVNASTIGNVVKANINSSWQTPEIRQEGKRMIATLRNTDNQAVYVEFGVGIVGQGNPHPNSNLAGYEYNISTEYKDSSGMWYFWTNSNELDLPRTSIEDIRGYDDFRGEKGKRIIVGTRGAQGTMYAYNACVDLQTFQFKAIWEQIKKRYWG